MVPLDLKGIKPLFKPNKGKPNRDEDGAVEKRQRGWPLVTIFSPMERAAIRRTCARENIGTEKRDTSGAQSSRKENGMESGRGKFLFCIEDQRRKFVS